MPQVRKAWPRGSTDDLSLLMLRALTLGLGFWILYGVIRADLMIVGANVIGAAFAATVLCCKLRDLGSRSR